MPRADQQARLDEAFERIEETILPCISMMLDTLIDASEAVPADDRRFLAAELKTLAAELEELTGSPVVRLNRAVAVAEADGPLAGLALLEDLDLPGHRLPAARAESAAATACSRSPQIRPSSSACNRTTS